MESCPIKIIQSSILSLFCFALQALIGFLQQLSSTLIGDRYPVLVGFALEKQKNTLGNCADKNSVEMEQLAYNSAAMIRYENFLIIS